MTTDEKLDKLKLNRAKKIGSVTVTRRDDGYEIEGQLYGREETVKLLDEAPQR